MSKYVIDGMYWHTGDNIYIDTQNDEDGYTVVCLNELIKDHIKENSKVTIIINVEKNDGLLEDLSMEQKEQM